MRRNMLRLQHFRLLAALFTNPILVAGKRALTVQARTRLSGARGDAGVPFLLRKQGSVLPGGKAEAPTAVALLSRPRVVRFGVGPSVLLAAAHAPYPVSAAAALQSHLQDRVAARSRGPTPRATVAATVGQQGRAPPRLTPRRSPKNAWFHSKSSADRLLGGESTGSAEDFPKVPVQRVDPDILEWSDLTVLLFQFAPALSLSEPHPISGPVGSAGKARDFHEGFQQHGLVSVAPAPIGPQRFEDAR